MHHACFRPSIFQTPFFSVRLVTVLAATSHVAGLSHVVLCVSVFCGDGKVGTRGSGQQGRDMLSLQAPPPRPRPSSAPMRPPHSSGEHNESRFEQPTPRDRRRRAHSRSVSRHRHRRARSPRRRRRSRTPAERRQEQTGPCPPPGNWHPAPAPQFPPPRPLLPHQHYMPPPRQEHMYAPPGWFPAHMQWPAAPFPANPQPQSSLKGQRMFNRSSDLQCRAAKRPSLTRANRLCH